MIAATRRELLGVALTSALAGVAALLALWGWLCRHPSAAATRGITVTTD